MPRWVLLKHTLPDGESHFDWLLEDPSIPEGPLISFRLAASLSWPPTSPFTALRIQPHRRLYLDYEGPVSGNRGEVVRVACGDADVLCTADSMRFALPTVTLRGRECSPTEWRFDLENPTDSGIMGGAVRS